MLQASLLAEAARAREEESRALAARAKQEEEQEEGLLSKLSNPVYALPLGGLVAMTGVATGKLLLYASYKQTHTCFPFPHHTHTHTRARSNTE